ncbi:MAG: hypothetical protein ACT4O3_05080, partial [Elusimicrobiota bacterium]
AAGFPHEERPYAPHVTLGRVAAGRPAPPALRDRSGRIFGSFLARDAALMESRPGPGGSVYSVRAAFPFAGAAGSQVPA